MTLFCDDILSLISKYSNYIIKYKPEINDIEIIVCCDMCECNLRDEKVYKTQVFKTTKLWKIDDQFLFSKKYIDNDRIVFKYKNLYYDYNDAYELNLFKYAYYFNNFLYGDKLTLLKPNIEIYAKGEESMYVLTREFKLYFCANILDMTDFIETYKNNLQKIPKEIIQQICLNINVEIEDIYNILTINTCFLCNSYVLNGNFFI